MSSDLQTYTTVERLFVTQQQGLARVSTLRTEGGYDSPHDTIVDAWCIFDTDNPSRLNHSPSFSDAMHRIRENTEDFASAAIAEPASLADSIAYGHDLGRVISRTALWANVPDLDLEHHSPRVAAGELRFSVCASTGSPFDIVTRMKILRYTYSLRTAELHTKQTGT